MASEQKDTVASVDQTVAEFCSSGFHLNGSRYNHICYAGNEFGTVVANSMFGVNCDRPLSGNGICAINDIAESVSHEKKQMKVHIDVPKNYIYINGKIYRAQLSLLPCGNVDDQTRKKIAEADAVFQRWRNHQPNCNCSVCKS